MGDAGTTQPICVWVKGHLILTLYDNKVGFYFGARGRRVLVCVCGSPGPGDVVAPKVPATADVSAGRRLQKQDTRPSGNRAPAVSNEHPRPGSARWHRAGPRGTQDTVDRFPGALLRCLPSRSHPSSPRHRVVHGQDPDGREGQTLPTPRSQRSLPEASPVPARPALPAPLPA